MDIISNYIETLRSQPRLQSYCAELESLLRSRLPWTAVPGLALWEARSGKWTFVLAEFSIEDQPNQPKGAVGYNVAISHTDGLLLFSDGKATHDLARLLNLYRKDIMQEPPQALPSSAPQVLRADFVGQGGAGLRRVVHLKQEQSYILDEATMPKAIAWLTEYIARLNGAEWGILATQTWMRFDSDNRIAYWRGNPNPEVFTVLHRMNWFVLQS